MAIQTSKTASSTPITMRLFLGFAGIFTFTFLRFTSVQVMIFLLVKTNTNKHNPRGITLTQFNITYIIILFVIFCQFDYYTNIML